MPRIARVSEVELFRVWRQSDELDVNWLFAQRESEAMTVGTAFHRALELGCIGDYETLAANGYTFHIQADIALELPEIREVRAEKEYPGMIVSGQVDALDGRIVYDHKTTKQFDADRYMASYQWRYYLDIFEANVFRYNIFVLKETDDPKIYAVSDFHRLEQRRYPDLHRDCEKLAMEYAEFMKAYTETQSFSRHVTA
jgi:hypothetical protein